MFTSFELFYLMVYLFTFGGVFSYFINYFTKAERGRNILSVTDKYMTALDDFLFDDLVENVEKVYNFDRDMDDTILVYLDNSEVSRCQLLLLQDLFPNNYKLAICLSTDSFHTVNLCRELGFDYFNKVTEYLNSDFPDEESFLINYCKNKDIKHCFMNSDNNSLMTLFLNGIYNNNYSEKVNDIERTENDGVYVYNIFSNQMIFSSYISLWDNCFGNLESNYTDNYYFHQDFINDSWRTNLTLIYSQLKDSESKLSEKVKDIFNIKNFKYGSMIEIFDNTLPYWLWENLFSQLTNNHNFSVEKQVIQTLYYIVKNNRKDDGDISSDWRYNYNNGTFILYNQSDLQDVLDDCNLADDGDGDVLDLNNSVEKFLDGSIVYKVLESSEEDYLIFPYVELNLENTNNEELFNNFNFKKYKVDSIVITK